VCYFYNLCIRKYSLKCNKSRIHKILVDSNVGFFRFLYYIFFFVFDLHLQLFNFTYWPFGLLKYLLTSAFDLSWVLLRKIWIFLFVFRLNVITVIICFCLLVVRLQSSVKCKLLWYVIPVFASILYWLIHRLMYKTTVYTLVNGRITHRKQQISENGEISQHDIGKVSMYCHVTFFWYLLFWMCNAAVN